MYASNVQSPRGDQGSMVGAKRQTPYPRLKRTRPRSRSLNQDQEKGAWEVQDRMKHTVDFNNKGFKPNTRGDFIQGSFATLEEAFRMIPESVGFDMEISMFLSFRFSRLAYCNCFYLQQNILVSTKPSKPVSPLSLLTSTLSSIPSSPSLFASLEPEKSSYRPLRPKCAYYLRSSNKHTLSCSSPTQANGQ